MKQFIYLLCAVSILAGGFASCKSDDPEIPNPVGSVIETEDGIVSRFYLANKSGADLDGELTAEFDLVDPTTGTIQTFTGNVKSAPNQIIDGERNALECNMTLGNANIPDGYYFISIRIEGELQFGPFYVSISGNSITPAKTASFSYSDLKGEGSKENPYKISSDKDFEYFLNRLREDPCHGYGVYFDLTADITLPDYNANYTFAETEFQGILNGNNHTLSNLRYDGMKVLAAGSVGLFSRISNAEISDLKLENVNISSIHSDAGALAGESKGRIVVRNVSAKGSVDGELNIGGLIGMAEGEVHITGCKTDLHVKGGNRTGGILGVFAHETSGTSEFSDLEIKGKVSGLSYTGGVVGLLKASKSPNIGGVTVGAYIEGTEDVGGFIGMADQCSVNLTADCFFHCAVPEPYGIVGTSNVGGFVGMIDLNEGGSLNLNSHVLTLNVAIHGKKDNIGGVIGYAKGGYINVHKINISFDTTMVESDGDCVGGIIGRMESIYLHADHSVNDKKELPQPSSYAARIAIKVRGGNYVGGAIGYVDYYYWGSPKWNTGGIYGIVCRSDVFAKGEIVGGVVGLCKGEIKDCVFIGKVSGMSNALIGGIIGKGQETIDAERCVNYSEITGGKYLGGICGYSNPADESSTNYTNCYNIGNLNDGMTVGGIVGYGGQQKGGSGFHIRMCENYGTIMAAGNSDHSVGGVVGDVDNDLAVVEWSANYADVGSKKAQYVIGGVVGKIGRSQVEQNDVHVTGCTNLGTITCDDFNTKLGGVVGHMLYGGSGIVAGNVNWGAIPGDQKSDTGGILGYATSFNYIHRNWNRGKIGDGNAIIGSHPGGTKIDHYANYYLEGSGKSWPDAIMITEAQMTHASNFPLLPWGGPQDYVGFTGEWFQMSTEGPVTMSFDFIHWDVQRLRPAGWHVDR